MVFQCCGKQVLPTSDRHVLFKIPWLDKESVGGGGGGRGGFGNRYSRFIHTHIFNQSPILNISIYLHAFVQGLVDMKDGLLVA